MLIQTITQTAYKIVKLEIIKTGSTGKQTKQKKTQLEKSCATINTDRKSF